MFSLKGKNAFVTGGTSGIGAAVAQRFAAAGANVVTAGRRDGHKLAEAIGSQFLAMDVTDESSIAAALDAAENRLGKLDILVNNAGVQDTGSTIEEHGMAAFDANVAILQRGVYLGLKYGPRHMRDGGSIINTSSIAGVIGVYGYGQYAMTKAAILSLTQVAAIELAPRGIRVNAVLPGTVRTPMVENEPEEIALTEALTPLGRIAEIEDVAGLYHFLAADESRYITGQKIAVDGGFTAGVAVDVFEMIASAQGD